MKKIKKQPDKHNTLIEDEKREAWVHFDDYLNISDGNRHPISEQGLKRLGKELVEWSETDEALVLEDFFRARGIPEMTYRDWKKRDELFLLRYETARGNLGSRREKKALVREYSERIVMNTMPKFDPSWKELEEWRSGLRRKENEAGSKNITVVMERFSEEEKHENNETETGRDADD